MPPWGAKGGRESAPPPSPQTPLSRLSPSDNCPWQRILVGKVSSSFSNLQCLVYFVSLLLIGPEWLPLLILIPCSADFLRARTSSGREPIITNTSDGLVSGNRMLLESIRSWMLMMRMTLPRQNSRNIASSRLPRKALENFGINSSLPLCNGAMSCLHSGLWRSLSSLSDAEMAEDVVESFLARNGATRDVAKLNEHEFKVFGNKVATKSEVEGFANTSQMGKGAS